jgi:hypothetical protein
MLSGVLPTLTRRLGPAADALRRIAKNPSLLRLELGSLAWSTADGAYLVGLLVLAYNDGGTAAAAFVAIIRALPSVVVTPVLLSRTDAVPRDRLLRRVVAVRVAFVLAATVEVVVGAPLAGIYLLIAIDTAAGGLLRPLRVVLTPALAHSPEELVAANVGTTTGDSLAALLGPAVAAVLLVVGGVPATFLTGTALMAVAYAAVLRINAPGSILPRSAPAADGANAPSRGSLIQATRALLALRHARLVVALYAGQRFVRGMLNVLIVATAFDLLAIGGSGVGVLTSAIGLGGLLGSAASLGLVGRKRLAPAFAAGLVAWGVGILACGVVPILVVLVAFLAVAGIGKVGVDVTGVTLLQRTVPDELRGRVVGLLEGMISAGLAIGPIVATLLVNLIGPEWALVIAGGLPLLLVAATWPVLRSADDAAVVPERELQLLDGVAMFRPLQLTTIEQLARQMVRRSVPAGADVVRQGDPGDSFYILESGRLETLVDGRAVGTLEAGDSFGEIALLRESARTATVRALDDSVVVELGSETFLAAVTSQPDSIAAADEIVRRRLAAS